MRSLGPRFAFLIVFSLIFGTLGAPRAAASSITLDLVSSTLLDEAGATATLTATVSDAGVPVTTGEVFFCTVCTDTVYPGGALDVNGQVQFVAPLLAGVNDWYAIYRPGNIEATVQIWGRAAPIVHLSVSPLSAQTGHPVRAIVILDEAWRMPNDTYRSVTIHDETSGLDLATIDMAATASHAADITGLAVGVHQLVAIYPANDLYDEGRSDPQTVTVTADPGVDISAPTISATSIFPYKDGYKDSVTIGFMQSEALSLKWDVLNGSKIVYTVSEFNGTVNNFRGLIWTGRTTAGKVVAAGKYTIRLTATDAVGNVLIRTWRVTVSSKRLVWHTRSVATKRGGAYSAFGVGYTSGSVKRGGTYPGGVRLTTVYGGWAGVAYSITLPVLSVPKGAVARKLTWSVNGSGPGANIAMWDKRIGSDWHLLDNYDVIGYTNTNHRTNNTSTPTISAHFAGHVFHGLVIATNGTYNVSWVRVALSYATLK